MSPKLNVLQKSFKEVQLNSSKFSHQLFATLIQRSPEFAKIFQWTDMNELRTHFMDSLERIVENADDPKRLAAFLEPLGKRHVRYGAKGPLYQMFGEVFLDALKQTLEDEWTPEAQTSWTDLCRHVIAHMMEGANEKPIDLHVDHAAAGPAPTKEAKRPAPTRAETPAATPAVASSGSDDLYAVTLAHARKLLTQAVEEEAKQSTFRAQIDEQLNAALHQVEKEIPDRIRALFAETAREVLKEIETESLNQLKAKVVEQVQRVLRETVEQETARILTSMTRRAA